MIELDEFTERHHYYVDWTARDYIDRVDDELDCDGVTMKSIVDQGRSGFRLQGDMLIGFVEHCISALLKAGAVPVYAVTSEQGYWIPAKVADAERLGLVQAIIKQWEDSGTDPGFEGLWFYRFDEKPLASAPTPT